MPPRISSATPSRAEARSDAGVVRGLHRPDALLEPVDEREVVRRAAEERLAEMDVRLDEAGQHGAAARVDDHVGPGRDGRADGPMRPPRIEHVAVAGPRSCGVHRHDACRP